MPTAIDKDSSGSESCRRNRKRYFVPDFVRWRVPKYKGKDLRCFAMYALGLRKEQLYDVEKLKAFKRRFCVTACRLNKHGLLYKSKRAMKRFLQIAREAWEKGVHIFYEYLDTLLPPVAPPEPTKGTISREIRGLGARPYWEPLSGPFRLRGRRAHILMDESATLEGNFDPERLSLLKVDGKLVNIPLGSFEFAYALSMIEHTRSGFFDEATLEIFFEDTATELNDWSQVPVNRPFLATLWSKDDAWYYDWGPKGTVVTKKVPKVPVTPGYGKRLRERLEAFLDAE